jgi:hypothetical protein
MNTLVLPVSIETHSDRAPEEFYSATFRERALSGNGAWSREARSLIELAAREGIMFEEEMLVVCDVRDLQALRRRLAE